MLAEAVDWTASPHLASPRPGDITLASEEREREREGRLPLSQSVSAGYSNIIAFTHTVQFLLLKSKQIE